MARIGITYDLKTDWAKAEHDPADINAEFDKPETLKRIVKALESGGHDVQKIGNAADLLKCIHRLDTDIVFNMCEGRCGRNRESQVPMILEMNNIPYVGSDALTLGMTLDKVVAKKLFISEGIPTPKYFQIRHVSELDQLDNIQFPLIVKTRHEGSSKGISQKSRVTSIDEFRRQVELINNTYKQPALVEEFIAGSEFTVAVLGNDQPKAMPVVQVSIDGKTDLGDEFYANERIYSDALQYVCPANISNELTCKIEDLALRVYNCVECKDFGRIDFRVDRDGNPYVLEINPLPSLDVEDVFNIFPQVLGSDYDGALNQVIAYAMKRYRITDGNAKKPINVFEQELEDVA